MKNFRLFRIVLFVLILLAGAGMVLLWMGAGISWYDLWRAVSNSTAHSLLLLILLYCLKPILWFIPLSGLYIGAGFLFTPGRAIAATYLGFTLEATLGFYLGRYLGNHSIGEMMQRQKYSKWLLEIADQNSTMGSFLVRLLPGPPCDVVNMFFGTVNMGYTKFLLASLLGITPGMLPFIFLGQAADEPLSGAFLVPLVVRVLLAVGSLLVYYQIKKNSHWEKIKGEGTNEQNR